MRVPRTTGRIGAFLLAGLTVLFLSGIAPRDASARAITGAIFTTNAGGAQVNGNIYASKDDVYLNGGPAATDHSTCQSAGLEDGDYYFQVTTPDGNTLLSSDGIESRKFNVTDGIYTYTGAAPLHVTTTSNCGVAIQLSPYADSVPTGEYKLWVTHIEDYPAEGCPATSSTANCSFGFKPSNTKTDNFRVVATPPEVAKISGEKFYDANADTILETATEVRLPGWPIQVCNVGTGGDASSPIPPGICVILFTNSAGQWEIQGLAASVYQVREGITGGWFETCPNNLDNPATTFDFFCSVDSFGNGFPTASPGSGVNLFTFVDTSGFEVALGSGGSVTGLRFGNVCVGAGGGVTLGFWSNKNGQKLIGSDDLSFLVSLNLRNANGSNFDPSTTVSTGYTQLRTWLLNATATNMAYMLSVQLATMELAVYNGLVSGSSLIYAPGTVSANFLGFATVNAVMNEANTALGSACGTTCDATTANIARRAYFEILKNALDKANNNLTFVQPDPTTCPAFPTTVAQ